MLSAWRKVWRVSIPAGSVTLNWRVVIQRNSLSTDDYIYQIDFFVNGLGYLSSIPGCVIPKTLKMVLNTTLLNTQQYKVRINSKVEQFRERSSALPYLHLGVVAIEYGTVGSPSTTVANLYIYIYIYIYIYHEVDLIERYSSLSAFTLNRSLDCMWCPCNEHIKLILLIKSKDLYC